MEIFKLLCIKSGNKLSQREIANLLKVSPTAVGNSLKLLEEEKLVIINRGNTNLNFVELNRENKKVLELKRIENLKLIIDSEFVDFLEEKYLASTIVLFGSYSNGNDTIASDIDIAIIGSQDKKVNLEKFEKLLEREIRINYYQNLNKINENLKMNIFNGIVLSGGFEL